MRDRPAGVSQTSVLQAGMLLMSNYFVVATELGDAIPGGALPAPGPPFRSGDGAWFEIDTFDPDGWRDFWRRLGAAEADLGRAWTVFQWRYERATCSLPHGLHEATARHSLAELRRVAAEARVSLTTLREYDDVLADLGGAELSRPEVRHEGEIVGRVHRHRIGAGTGSERHDGLQRAAGFDGQHGDVAAAAVRDQQIVACSIQGGRAKRPWN